MTVAEKKFLRGDYQFLLNSTAFFLVQTGKVVENYRFGEMNNLEILIWMIAVVVLVSLIMGIYSTNKYFKVKEQEMKLEQERLELERKRLEKN